MRIAGLILIVLIVVVFIAMNSGFHSWKYDQTVDGVRYERIRWEQSEVDQGRHSIGQLAEPTEVNGLQWAGWLHRRENGSISGGMLAEDGVIGPIRVPADTWVSFDSEGVLSSCHFPQNQTIQGHECRGTGGGSKGAVVNFYPDGELKQYFAPSDIIIQDIPCRGGLFDSVHLYRDGRLKQCTLAEAATVDGQSLKSGTRIELDQDGRLIH